MESWITPRNKNLLVGLWIIGSLLACNKPNIENLLANSDGQSWDIIYISNKTEKYITEGFCFYPNHTFYSFRYNKNGHRVPYHNRMWDVQLDSTIGANLRTWKIIGDTALDLDGEYYKVRFDSDTLFLFTGIKINPILKLIKTNG